MTLKFSFIRRFERLFVPVNKLSQSHKNALTEALRDISERFAWTWSQRRGRTDKKQAAEGRRKGAIMHFAMSQLKDRVIHYQTSVGNILQTYRRDLERAAAIYNEQTLATHKAELIQRARVAIVQANKDLNFDFSIAADKMRDRLAIATTAPVKPAFVENMRTLKEFGVKIGKSELETYIQKAAGNLTALRILDTVAKASGFRLRYTTVDDLQDDIVTLRKKGVGIHYYAPDGYTREALEVFPDVELYRDDGSAWTTMGRPVFTTIILGTGALDALVREGLDEIKNRWTSSTVPTLEEISERLIKENDGKKAEDHEQTANNELKEATQAAADAVDVRPGDMKIPSAYQLSPEEKQRSEQIIQSYIRK